jgi:hypothetical protein
MHTVSTSTAAAVLSAGKRRRPRTKGKDAGKKRMQPVELGTLAKKLAGCTDESEATRLKNAVVNGFYGGKCRA